MASSDQIGYQSYEQPTTDTFYEAPTHDRFSSGCAWIEGNFVPISEARIPILDMGFTRSDLTYDVVAVWNGGFFRLEDHLDRLLSGCEKLRLAPPLGRDKIRQILIDTVALSGLREAYVEVIVTRGIPEKGERDPRQIRARLYAYAIPYIWIVNQKDQENGIALAISQYTDRISVRSVDPTIKNFHWGDLTRALFEAYDNGASLPILTDGHGKITEGPGYNVFALFDGRLYTPAAGVLEGITRKTVIELAQLHHIDMIVGEIDIEMFRAADEIFLTSTAGGVMPVSTLDGKTVGSGRPGPVAMLLRDKYWKLHDDEHYFLAIDY
jgi:branched-chain amino acid aminotransferase